MRFYRLVYTRPLGGDSFLARSGKWDEASRLSCGGSGQSHLPQAVTKPHPNLQYKEFFV
jgi:hypothetical protein